MVLASIKISILELNGIEPWLFRKTSNRQELIKYVQFLTSKLKGARREGADIDVARLSSTPVVAVLSDQALRERLARS